MKSKSMKLAQLIQGTQIVRAGEMEEHLKQRIGQMFFYGGATGTLMSWGLDAKTWNQEFSLNGKSSFLELSQQRLGMGLGGSLIGLAAGPSGDESTNKEPFSSGGIRNRMWVSLGSNMQSFLPCI